MRVIKGLGKRPAGTLAHTSEFGDEQRLNWRERIPTIFVAFKNGSQGTSKSHRAYMPTQIIAPCFRTINFHSKLEWYAEIARI